MDDEHHPRALCPGHIQVSFGRTFRGPNRNWNSDLRFETPFGVTDGARKEVIIAEIGKSKSVFTQAGITALQQSNPNIDPDIIKCMKNHPS
jgi:hypothetical protein